MQNRVWSTGSDDVGLIQSTKAPKHLPRLPPPRAQSTEGRQMSTLQISVLAFAHPARVDICTPRHEKKEEEEGSRCLGFKVPGSYIGLGGASDVITPNVNSSKVNTGRRQRRRRRGARSRPSTTASSRGARLFPRMSTRPVQPLNPKP